jgi:hypothetical protein
MDVDDHLAPTAEDTAVSPARRRRVPAVRPLTLVIAILIAAVLAESVLLFRGNADERARSDIIQVSQRFLVLLTTYSATTLEQQRPKVLALATGRFPAEYEQIAGAEFLAALKERQAESTGRVLRVAVTDVRGDNASVLALVEVKVTNKELTTPKVEQNVMDLSLVQTRNGWKIDSVSLLGTI